MGINLADIQNQKIREAARQGFLKAVNRMHCPRCELHGGPNYIDGACPVCHGRGYVKRDEVQPARPATVNRLQKYNPELVLTFFEEWHLEPPRLEYRFHLTRLWRFDFAWPNQRVALEVEGGIFKGQGHASINGILRDLEKYNEAAILGWRVLRRLPDKLCTAETVNLIFRALESASP